MIKNYHLMTIFWHKKHIYKKYINNKVLIKEITGTQFAIRTIE